MTLTHLSDDELLEGLARACFEARRLEGRLLLHLIEVEARRLDLKAACSSMFDFCRRRLGMSDGEAFRRIAAARLVKRFPCLLEALERGDLHLSTLLLLRDHVTTDNVYELLRETKGKTKREVQEVIAAQTPRTDVFPTLTELPAGPAEEPAKARIEPLSPTRHRLEVTVSDEVRAKLERARDLLGHRIPNGSLETVIDRALDALLGKLEKERPGHGIAAAVRREVFARDGERCTYTDTEGRRCTSRTRLELDHVDPRARDGSDDADNLRVVCRAHNRLYAEEAFGREHVARQIHLRQRKSDEEARDRVTRGLVNLGFRERDARRALGQLFPPDTPLPPPPDMVRQALATLVPS